MKFVFCHTKQAEGLIEELPRLYAYPKVPDISGDELVILDSGAFGLGKQGRMMTQGYIRALREHYRRYVTKPNVIPIGPDEFLNPDISMRRYKAWMTDDPYPVVPVLQRKRRGALDIVNLRQQLYFYLTYASHIPVFDNRPFIAIGNAGMNPERFAKYAPSFRKLFDKMFPNGVWLHNLGAGWSPQDVKIWASYNVFDSIDSTMWYAEQPIDSYPERIRQFNGALSGGR